MRVYESVEDVVRLRALLLASTVVFALPQGLRIERDPRKCVPPGESACLGASEGYSTSRAGLWHARALLSVQRLHLQRFGATRFAIMVIGAEIPVPDGLVSPASS